MHRENGGGRGGEREIFLSPANIVNKSSNGIRYALLLVDYDTCYHSSTGDIDEECDIEGERHLLSNRADIEATIKNAVEHFLYEKSLREEQKICLKQNPLRNCNLRKCERPPETAKEQKQVGQLEPQP